MSRIEAEARPWVSVIIAAHNGASTLPTLCDALENQTIEPQLMEVIIVDDGSRDDTVRVLGRYGWVHLIRLTDNLGAPVARNLGARASRGRLLAFTDVDCIPERSWIQRGVAHFSEQPHIDALGGEVLVTVDQTSSVCAFVDTARFLNQEKAVRSGGAVTANFWIRRNAFFAVDGFNERLARLGYPDTELTAFLSARGATIGYGGDVLVRHSPRATRKELWRKGLRLGLGHARFRRHGRAGVRYRSLPLFLRLRRLLPRAATSNLYRLEQRDIGVTPFRRLQMVVVELACVSAPMFLGDVVGTLREIKQRRQQSP